MSLLINAIDEDQAVIWEWKTGKVLLVCHRIGRTFPFEL